MQHDPRSPIAYTKPVFDDTEIQAVLGVLKKGWLGMKDKAMEFEQSIAKRVGVAHCRLCNSGSSSNLLAISALELPKGSEVITPACTFPTTLNPLLQNGLVPVFVEVNRGFVLDVTKVEAAVTDKTRAIMVPHLLGNMPDMTMLMDIARTHSLAVIEDCCDAFESRWEGKNAGTFGVAGTFSLYASHHFTAAGEGGAVISQDEQYHNKVQQYRDWGRIGDYAWNQDTRFNVNLSNGTPFDERYYFRVIGYNLKMTEMQAAFGLEQMKRLSEFRTRRIANFQTLYKAFSAWKEYFDVVEWDKRADPAWFTFPFLIKDAAGVSRNEAIDFLHRAGVDARPLFVGNILLHPAYQNIPHRISGDLSFSNDVARRGMFIGVGPQLTTENLEYILEKIQELVGQKRK